MEILEEEGIIHRILFVIFNAATKTMSRFILENSPLAIVLGQVSFSFAPEFNSCGDVLRMAFKNIGLPIVARQQSTHFEHVSPQSPPRVENQTIWMFTNPEKSCGVSIGPKHLAFVKSDYKSFPEFSEWVGRVTRVVEEKFPGTYFCNVGLRYVNAFSAEAIPSNYLVDSVRGISSEGIDTDHVHHKYEFWCTTKKGVLISRCNLIHGGKVPAGLEIAANMYPARFLFESKDHVYLVDIFENSNPLDPQRLLCENEVLGFFADQHDTIETAFLNTLSTEGKEHFGWKQHS